MDSSDDDTYRLKKSATSKARNTREQMVRSKSTTFFDKHNKILSQNL